MTQRNVHSCRFLACVAVVSVSFSQAGQARKTREGIGQLLPSRVFRACPAWLKETETTATQASHFLANRTKHGVFLENQPRPSFRPTVLKCSWSFVIIVISVRFLHIFLNYSAVFSAATAHNQREISPFCPSFPAKTAQEAKTDHNVPWVTLESRGNRKIKMVSHCL